MVGVPPQPTGSAGDGPLATPAPGVAPTPWPAPDGADVLLFGGSFDPPHRGHVEPAVAARDHALGVGAWLVYVPAARSPHKATAPAAADAHRVAMLRLIAADIPRAAVWTDELDRAAASASAASATSAASAVSAVSAVSDAALTAQPEPQYWVDTLRRARAAAGSAATLAFLIGADQAVAFHRWREPRRMLTLARPVVVLRPPLHDRATLRAEMAASGFWSPEELDSWDHAVCTAAPQIDASATAVRARRTGHAGHASHPGPASSLYPAVAAYIAQHGLYAPPPVA